MDAEFAPGWPVEFMEITPFSFPCMASDTEFTFPVFRSSEPLVWEIEPTDDAFFCVPYPTTTISSRNSDLTSMRSFPDADNSFRVISRSLYPTHTAVNMVSSFAP